MSSEALENAPARTADRLLLLLKKRGPQTAAEMGCVAGVCGEAVRQQLVRLAKEGLVESVAEPRGVGRPVQVWSLTSAGNARFPDAHAKLAARLIEAIRTELGEAALDRTIHALAGESKAAYAAAVGDAADLGERVRRLAAARSREGYMAEVKREGGGYLLIENHCPICVVAQACGDFTGIELDMFRAVLGPDAAVERTEHLVQGDRRCVYRITRKKRQTPRTARSAK